MLESLAARTETTGDCFLAGGTLYHLLLRPGFPGDSRAGNVDQLPYGAVLPSLRKGIHGATSSTGLFPSRGLSWSKAEGFRK